MKVAIPTRGNIVDDHFGHCELFTVFTIEQNDVKNIEELASIQGCGCKSNIMSDLQQLGVSVMLAGNMGNGGLNVLKSHGIEVFRGCSGDIHQLIRTFLQSKIIDSGEGCKVHEHHHGEGEHQCNHHH